MPSLFVTIEGRRWSVPKIAKMTKGERCEQWPEQWQRVLVARLHAEKKLGVLATRGVTWDGVSGFSRLKHAKFGATRKREYRLVRGVFSPRNPPPTFPILFVLSAPRT